MIVPSIDLLGGKVVQLRGGDPQDCRVALDDVLGVAERLHRHGELAVIDLDAALGRGDNFELVRALCQRFDCRVGGGIRDFARADALLRAGARKIIIGTRATPDFLGLFPPERLIVALDARGGEVVDHGWTRGTGATVLGRAKALAPSCSEFLYTLVDREGRLGGTDLAAVRALVDAVDRHVVAAGGITSLDEIRALDAMGASCQLGMAIYTGALDLAEATASLVDFSKHDGLVPVVVQDAARQVVMHAWANTEALRRTLTSGDAWYFSRSRQSLWRKGATSGATQRVRSVRRDCDADTILYEIEQTDGACHLPDRYSCFGDKRFALERLEETLLQRRRDASEGAGAGSYTARLMREPGLCEAKIVEEAAELASATAPAAVAAEAADLVLFVMAKLARDGIPWRAVLHELDARQGRRRQPNGQLERPVAAPPAASPDAAAALAGAADGARGMAGAGVDPAKVAALLSEVARDGDAALARLSARFDGVVPASWRFERPALVAALDALPEADRRALERAAANIRRVAEAQRQALGAFALEVEPGVVVRQQVLPIGRVACYVPGGRHPLASTVLMTAIPARVAGCREVIVLSPPQRDGRPAPAVLAAAALAGADAVIPLGGVQAVAAVAYGTTSVPRCDLLVGPGNAWFTEAKRQVVGRIGIDGVAGPSEVLVLADSSADPDRIAADLLAQAEHDVDARARLYTTDAALAERVRQALDRQLASLPAAAVARAALAGSGAPQVFATVADLVAAADAAAPEHLHLHLADAAAVAPLLRCYGALFVGGDAAEVFGDYCAGSNHVLPTAGAARYAGGLSVATFCRLVAWQEMDPSGAAALAPVAARLARLEGLEAHARAAELRRGEEPPGQR